MNIIGIKPAVGIYEEIERKAKKDLAWYGAIMFDVLTGEVWCDEFYDISHTSYKNYKGQGIINLSRIILLNGEKVTMKTVKEYANAMIVSEK